MTSHENKYFQEHGVRSTNEYSLLHFEHSNAQTHQTKINDEQSSQYVLFEHIFNSAPGCFLVLNLDFTIIASTDEYLNVTNTQRSDVIGKYMFDVFPDNPDDLSSLGTFNLRSSFETVIATKKPHTMRVQKYDIRLPNSEKFEVRYWLPKNVPVIVNNEIKYLIHRVEDVTTQEMMNNTKEIQQTLNSDIIQREQDLYKITQEHEAKQGTAHENAKLMETRFKTFTDTAPVGFFVASDQKEIIYLNKFALNLCTVGQPFNAESELHELFYNSIHEDDHETIREHLCSHMSSITFRIVRGGLFNQQTTTTTTTSTTTTEPSIIWILSNCIAEFDTMNNITSYIGSLTDITRMVEMKQEMEITCDTICHEIRNSIHGVAAAVEGASEVLNQATVNNDCKVKKVEPFLDNLKECVNYQQQLASNLLIASKLHQDQTNNKKQDVLLTIDMFTVGQLVSKTLHLFETLIFDKQLQIQTSISNGSQFIYSDATRLKQVFINLLSNAIKFSHNGGTICISAAVDVVAATLSFQVKDNGIGISLQDQKKLFTSRFVKINSQMKNVESTGLGLSICKELVENVLHGTISVRSELNKGSEFTVTVPVQFPTMQQLLLNVPFKDVTIVCKEFPPFTPIYSENENSQQFLNILIADDNSIIRKIYAKMMDTLNYKYTMVTNGKEAVEAAQSTRFDLVLLDWYMPIMDGNEAAKLLKQMDSKLPIVLVTGTVMDQLQEEMKELNITGVLQKPFTFQELSAVIKRECG